VNGSLFDTRLRLPVDKSDECNSVDRYIGGMSESTREANGDSESESSASPNQSYSTESSNSSSTSRNSNNNIRDCSGDLSCSSSTTTATRDSQASESGANSSSNITNGSNWQPTWSAYDNRKPSSSRVTNETEESINSILKNRGDEVIQQSQQMTGFICDTKPGGLKDSCSSSPRLELNSNRAGDQICQDSDSPHLWPSTSQSTNDSFSDMHQRMRLATLKPVPSGPSSSTDTNNNRNSSSNTRIESLCGLRKNNFSKSASGGRLMNRNESRTKVCDCLSQNCSEKEHSNRRRFIESYYNNRTRLPSANAMSTSNISTPLNRLSECDEITKRLLSSPIRTVNLLERPNRRIQIGDIDKSRRASLGTHTTKEQVPLFTSSQFDSLDSSYSNELSNVTDNQDCHQKQQSNCPKADNSALPKEGDGKLKQQQQQGRSLSVCQDDGLNPRLKNNSSNHSLGLNRAVSLACETGSSKQLLTIIPLFGCDIKALEQFSNLGSILPPPIDSAIGHILAHGINAIGIFRKSGVKSRILTLRKRIETNQDASFDEINRNNEFSIYDIADLVKMWFRELKPMPLMTKDLIRLISNYLQMHGSANTCASQQKRGKSPNVDLESIEELHGSLKKQIDTMISPTHRALFSKAIAFFATISSNSDINQMTSQNLAICLTPSLCATESDQTSILVAQGALKYCIDNYRILF
jgi:hypothetical protein